MARRCSRKRQRKLADTILQTYNCYHVSSIIEGLYWGEVHPHDLPKHFSAYKMLAKFFQHGKPAAQKMLYFLVRTRFFDTQIKAKRWERISTIYESQYTGKYTGAKDTHSNARREKKSKSHKWFWKNEGDEPEKFFLSKVQVEHLIRLVELLVAKGNYRWMDFEAFDYEQIGEEPIACLQRLLSEVFRIEVDAPVILSCILSDDGLTLFENILQGQFTYRRLFPSLSKEEKIYFYQTVQAKSLLEAYLMAILQGCGATEDEAVSLVSNIKKDQMEVIQKSIQDKGSWLKVLPLLVKIHRKGAGITQRLMTYFATFIQYADKWVREPADWDCDKASADNKCLFVSLRDHLFQQYEVPKFLKLDKLYYWMVNNPEWDMKLKCYFQIASGGNVRQTEGLPVKLSKKVAHYFMEAHDEATIEQAYRFALVRVAGGSKELAQQVADFVRTAKIADEGFFKEVIGFLARHFTEGTPNMKEILLYIRYQYGREKNYSLKGRTKASFLRNYKEFLDFVGKFAEENRRVLGNNGRLPSEFSQYDDLRVFFYHYIQKASWGKASIKEFKHSIVKAKHSTAHYAIRQLHSADTLREEGKNMGHCVATYILRSFQEMSLIFSLRQLKQGNEDFEEGERMLTIEVSNYAIVQIKGLRNRRPTKEEMVLVKKWAGEAGLKVA